MVNEVRFPIQKLVFNIQKVERKYRTLFVFKLTTVRILYAQRCKHTVLSTMEERRVKMELAEMAKLTILIKENLSSFFP